jgi:hypothetical protein
MTRNEYDSLKEGDLLVYTGAGQVDKVYIRILETNLVPDGLRVIADDGEQVELSWSLVLAVFDVLEGSKNKCIYSILGEKV